MVSRPVVPAITDTPSGRQLDLGPIAFYWRTTDRPAAALPPGIPSFLPFAFGHTPEIGLLCQALAPETRAALRVTYLQESNIGYMQPGHALADQYGGEFLAF